MSNDAPQQPKASPSHIAYLVTQNGEGHKPDWRKAGAAWTNQDGGLNLKLDDIPKEKNLVLRPARKKRSLSLF